MASAEHLLHEAQYAFASISFGESRENTRNRARARSLCKKILRKYPGSMEAGEAVAILRRLGDEAFTSNLAVRHRHITERKHHEKKRAELPPEVRTFITERSDDETLNWAGLILLIVKAPKILLAMLIAGGLFLFSILGPLLFVPLVLLVLFMGPMKAGLNRRQRTQMNGFVASVNTWINERHRS